MLTALASALLLTHLSSAALAWHRKPLHQIRLHKSEAPQGLIGTPKITLLRPVCGLDPLDAETLGSSFGLDYPDYEIIFCAGSETDPVLPLLRDLIAAHPAQRARILVGQDHRYANPKLGNVAKGWDEARDWVAMVDANLLLPRDYLHQLVQSWGPRTGLVSAPPCAVRPEGFAARLEAVTLNAKQARLQLAADSLGFGFAQGKTLFFNRPLMQSLGGLPALDRMLAEDVATTKRIRAAGLEISLAAEAFAQPIGQRSLKAVWARQLRWSRVRREGFPILAYAEALNGALVPALICALGTGSGLLTLAYLAAWWGAEWALCRAKGWPARWRDAALLPLADAMALAIWAVTPFGRGFVWRGTAMQAKAA